MTANFGKGGLTYIDHKTLNIIVKNSNFTNVAVMKPLKFDDSGIFYLF